MNAAAPPIAKSDIVPTVNWYRLSQVEVGLKGVHMSFGFEDDGNVVSLLRLEECMSP